MGSHLPSESYVSEAAFAHERRVLAAHAWQFVGMTDDLAAPNDWLRAGVFGVDAFVQNFAGELRGYHNACAHRGFPIRREPRGNGTVQCGFHGWVYNRAGVPTGIPRNAELFQFSRDAQAALALPEVRVEAVGRFVFAALAPSVPPLASFLGRYADVLRAISARLRVPKFRHASPIRANWKLCFEITLDDYHLQMVHATTFGAGDPGPIGHFFYGREGDHSYMFKRRDVDWPFATYWDDVARGDYDFTGYKIHQIYPNLVVATARDCALVTAFRADGVAHTIAEDLYFGLHGTPDTAAQDAVLAGGWATHRQVQGEDRGVSEAQQTAIGSFARAPTIGRLEERVGWFHDTHAAYMRRT